MFDSSNFNLVRMQEEKKEELAIYEAEKVNEFIEEQNEFMNDNIVIDAQEKSISGLIPAGILNHDELQEIIESYEFTQLMITAQHNVSELIARYRFSKSIN